MRVEYIGHSGVLVELDHTYLLFDVIASDSPIPRSKGEYSHDVGSMPVLDPAKVCVVFASHNHGDHYSEAIWKLRETQPLVKYILSKDIHFSSGVRARLGISDEYAAGVIRLKGYTSSNYDLPDGSAIHVQTIPSTDEGVAFLVSAEGKLIYHAGDHHMWMWESNGVEYMDAMESAFRQAVSRLEIAGGQSIDLAFLLLDGRLENHAYDGMDAYLDMLPIRNVVPIHQWGDYSITDRYLEALGGCLDGLVRIYRVTGENCEFEI